MRTCTFCKGETRDGFGTFTVDVGRCIVVIRHVPAQICAQCGEAYYSTEVMRQLYRIAQSVQVDVAEITIVNYQPAA